MHRLYRYYTEHNIPENRIVFFIHTREPEEIKRFKDDYGAVTLLIKKNDVVENFSNTSDKNVDNYEYDFIIENNGTLEELEQKAIDFLKELQL